MSRLDEIESDSTVSLNEGRLTHAKANSWRDVDAIELNVTMTSSISTTEVSHAVVTDEPYTSRNKATNG